MPQWRMLRGARREAKRAGVYRDSSSSEAEEMKRFKAMQLKKGKEAAPSVLAYMPAADKEKAAVGPGVHDPNQ